MDRPDDVVRDILDRLSEALTKKQRIDSAFWQSFEHDIRQHWGGELQYIAKTSDAQIEYKTRRDREIVREAQRGEHNNYLARRYGLSLRRVQQIVRSALP